MQLQQSFPAFLNPEEWSFLFGTLKIGTLHRVLHFMTDIYQRKSRMGRSSQGCH